MENSCHTLIHVFQWFLTLETLRPASFIHAFSETSAIGKIKKQFLQKR